MKTQTQIRASFWNAFPEFKKEYKRADVKQFGGMAPTLKRYVEKRQNDYCTDIRCAFCDYVDSLCKNGVITQELAESVTL